MKFIKLRYLNWIAFFALLLFPLIAIASSNPANAGTGFDINDMLQNFAKTFPSIQKLITGACYVIGIIFALRALYYLKVYGELRTMMSTNSSLRPPLTYLLVCIVFIYLPTAIDILMSTIYGTTQITPLSYAPETKSQFGSEMTVILAFVQIIGLIAFIRGWVIIAHTSQQGGRETVGKGITHIIGGILAINIVGTRDILWHTFGFN